MHEGSFPFPSWKHWVWDQPTPDTITSRSYAFKQKPHHWRLKADLSACTRGGVFCLLLKCFKTVCCWPRLRLYSSGNQGVCAVHRGVWSCWSMWSLVVTPGSDLSPPCWSYRKKQGNLTVFIKRNNVCSVVTRLRRVWTFVVKVMHRILLIIEALLLNPLSISTSWHIKMCQSEELLMSN